jgi:N-acetylmuramoyl-L-alanine amidase CwlA
MKPIVDKLAKRANYGSARSADKVKYIVIHYTANDGDSAKGNANYFATKIVKASAHYFVDDNYIYRAVPENYVAYAVGGKKYNNAGGRLYGQVTNANSISVELCDTLKNGVYYPTERTIDNALELVKYLMKRYNIPAHRVIRHYDVNGKACPAYWVNESSWEMSFHGRLGGERAVSAQDVNPYKEPSINITSNAVAKAKGLKTYASNGVGVKWLQWELEQVSPAYKSMIEASGGIDGKCGSTTVNLLIDFQRNYGLTPDGVCGQKTREALKKN